MLLLLQRFFFFLEVKTGKRSKNKEQRVQQTEAIIKDASTPGRGQKAYYNEAIDAKKDQYNKANQIYTQMLGKITSYEEQLRALQKENMQLNLNINACIDKGDDEGAKVYLKKQQDAEDKIAVLKDTLKELRSNATAQKEMLDSALQAVNDLKSEKDKAILTLETAQVTKILTGYSWRFRQGRRQKCLKLFVKVSKSKKKLQTVQRLHLMHLQMYSRSALIRR